MKRFRACLLCLAIVALPVAAQLSETSQTSEEIKRQVAYALAENQRVTVKIKGQAIPTERKGIGLPKMNCFSGKVVEVAQGQFVLCDTVLVFGSILVTVPFEKVASVKPQSKSLYRLRKTGESAAASVAVAGLTAVVVPGYFICIASNGKLCPRWTSPR